MIDNDAKIFLQTDGGHYGQAVCFLSYYNQASDAKEVIWLVRIGVLWESKQFSCRRIKILSGLMVWQGYNNCCYHRQ